MSESCSAAGADPQPEAPLVRAIIEHLSDDGLAWTSLSIVIVLNPSGKAQQSYGYSFNGDGPPQAISTDTYEVRPAVSELLETVGRVGAALPAAMLVQVDRPRGLSRVVFEDSDTGRWRVTPRNLEQSRESLRPHFA